MTNQNDTSRPLLWEDEAPAVTRVRRMQEGTPQAVRVRRGAPGMPLEMEDPDGDGDSRPSTRDAARGKWWRPAGKTGRIFLALGVLIILGGFTFLGIALRKYLERDARFRIAGAANIQATGLTQVSRAQMLPVFGEDIGRNVFFVPLSERRKQLEQIPWVEHATVMRVLPDQIRIALVERQPVAFTRVGQQIGLVDADGVLLSMPAAAMSQHGYRFPVITGIDPGDPPASRKARMAVYGRLISELDSSGQRLSQQISEIDLTDPEDARVLQVGTDILAHFGEDHFLDRYQRYQAHIAEWRQQYPNLAAVDLRYEQQVVLQMASGKQASQPATGADGSQSTASSASSADGKPVAGTPASDPKPQPNKKSTVDKTAKPHSVHDKKKRADQRHTASNQHDNTPGTLAGRAG